MAFDAGKIEASLDLDRSPFQRSLDEAKRQGRDFESQRYASKVDADTTEATAKIIDIRDRLDRLSTKKVTPSIDLEGFAEAEAKVAVLQHQLDKLDRTAGGSGGRGGVLGRLAEFGRGGFFGGTGLLGVAGASAAVPLGIGAAGLGASLLTPTVAGVAGLGLFGAASKSAIERVGKEQKQLEALNQRIANTSQTNPGGTPQQIAAAQARLNAAQVRLAQVRASDTSTPASIASAQASVTSAQSSLTSAQGGGANPAYDKLLQQRKQLLSTMTPAERAAAQGIQEFEHAWKHFQRELEPQTFRLLATGTDIFRKGLHDVLPMTKAVGDEVDTLAKRADRALSQPFWRHFFGDFLTREAPRAVDTLGTVVGNVVTGFAHLAEDFAPLGHRIEDDVVRWSGMFDKWTQGSGPQQFVALVEKDGPIAAQALEALAHGLTGLLGGLEPIGRIELQALTPVLNFIGDLGRQHPEVITALGVAYLGVAAGLKAIAAVNSIQKTLDNASSASRTLGGGLSGLRRSALLTAGAIGVFEIGKHAGSASSATLGGALAGLTVGMLAFGPEGAAVGAVVGGLAALGTHLITATGEAKNLTDQVDALSGSLEAAIKLDKGLLGKNVRGQVKQTLLTNPDFQKPGIGGLTFLQTLTKYGVTEKQVIDYASGRGESRSISNVIGAARSSGNKEFLDQFTELMESIIQAVGEFKDIRQFGGGRGGRHGHGHRAAGHPASQQHAGTTNYYDLRGSKFEHVNHPHQLERQLKQKQRLAALGPGEQRIGFDR